MVTEKKERIGIWDGIKMYGAENNTVFDKICAFLLVLSPILQHYVGLYENAGFTVLLLISPLLIVRLLYKVEVKLSKNACIAAIMPILFFEIYSIFNRSFGVNQIIYGGFMVFILFAVAMGCVNIAYVLKSATFVANCAAVIITIQYVFYYGLNERLRFIPDNLLHSDSDRWNYILSEHSVGTLYRPSAFFLEPSHMFLFCFPIVCLLLLLPNMTKKRMWAAIVISVAIVMCTSGMGLFVVVGLWALYLVFFYKNTDENKVLDISKAFTGRGFLVILSFAVVALVAYTSIDVISSAIERIFINESGSTAIEGRVRLANNLIRRLEGRTLMFGVTSDIIVGDIEASLSGFHATLYKRGIVGIVLSYLFYVQGIFKLKTAYFWLTVVILIISFFTAHTHGTFYMMYYIFFLMNGYFTTPKKEKKTANRYAAAGFIAQ